MKDRQLLEILKNDPERGMEKLIARDGGIVTAAVKSRLFSGAFCESDVEDCVADTFSEFYCSLSKLDPKKGSVRAWLCLIARRNATDRLRQYYQEKGTAPLDDTKTQFPDNFSLEIDFEDRMQRARVLEAIKALGEPDRSILVRKYYFAQSSKQIAAALHLTISNVDTRAHRAIQKLKKELGVDDE